MTDLTLLEYEVLVVLLERQRDETIRQMSDTITDMANRIAELEAVELDYQNELKVKDRHADRLGQHLDELQAARFLISDTTSVPDAIMIYQERIQQLEAHVKQLGGRLADATAENLAWQRIGELMTDVIRRFTG